MYDWMDYVMPLLLGACTLFFIAVVAGLLFFTIGCYSSGNPDSMACYMLNGSTSRHHIDATVNVK